MPSAPWDGAAPKAEPPSQWQDGKKNVRASFGAYFILKHGMAEVLTPASVLSYWAPLRSHCCFRWRGKEALLLPQSLCLVQVMLHNLCRAEVGGFACIWLGRTVYGLVAVLVGALQPLAQLPLKSAEKLWWYYCWCYYYYCYYYYHYYHCCCYCFPLISYHLYLLKKPVPWMSLESWQW